MLWNRYERLLRATDQHGQPDGISLQRVQQFQESFTAPAPVSRTRLESGHECHLLTRGTQEDRVEGTVFISVRLDRTGGSRSKYLHGRVTRRARKGSGCRAADRDGVHELGTRSIRVGFGGSSRGRSAIVQEEDPRRRPDGMVVHDHASRRERRVRDRQREYLHDHQDQSWREISQVDRGSRIGQEDAMDRDGSFGQWTTRVRVGTSLEKGVPHGCGTHGRRRATTHQ